MVDGDGTTPPERPHRIQGGSNIGLLKALRLLACDAGDCLALGQHSLVGGAASAGACGVGGVGVMLALNIMMVEAPMHQVK